MSLFVNAVVQRPVTSPVAGFNVQVRVSVLFSPSQENKRSGEVESEASTGLLALVKYSKVYFSTVAVVVCPVSRLNKVLSFAMLSLRKISAPVTPKPLALKS